MSTLVAARERKGLSQEALADLAGVSRKTVIRIENDPSYSTKVDVARRLAGVLETSLDDLFAAHAEDSSALPTGRGKNTGTRSAAGKRSPGPDSRKGE